VVGRCEHSPRREEAAMAESRVYHEFNPTSGVLQRGAREAEQAPPASEPTAAVPHAVIRRYEGLDPRTVDEVARRVNEGLVPLLSQLPGFVAYCALDAGGGVVASITICADQAGADEATRTAAVWAKEHLASLVPKLPEFTAGKIIAYTVK
jgi:hypothetical protein